MQQMTINRKSWHYRFNVWFYGKWRIEDMTNGCPYFWGTILAMVLTPLKLLVIGLNRGVDAIPRVYINLPHVNMPQISDKTAENIVIGLVVGLLVAVASATIYEILIGNWIPVAITYGIIGVTVGTILGIVYLSEKIDDYRRMKRFNESPKIKTPNPVVQMVKAKKNKYCPKLVITN